MYLFLLYQKMRPAAPVRSQLKPDGLTDIGSNEVRPAA